MGIQGLIPFVKCCTGEISVNELSGKTVAVDSYCWLHKGVFGCAEQLVMGDNTTRYVDYCLKLVNLLLSNNVKVIMVFDGRSLPAKAQEETSRQEARASAKKMAQQYLRLGRRDSARRFMVRSIDITHNMASKLIQACHKLDVDCIVAPYEADAQLAYLSLNKITDFVITEDSDLILFGCTKVVFKFTINGQGLLFDSTNLHLTMNLPKEDWDFALFRRMCILSGCDYLPSLQGIGLVKAKKFVLKTRTIDISEAINKIYKYLNMDRLQVPESYVINFFKSEATFMYQYVFDPIKRAQVRLTQLSSNIPNELLTESGELWNAEEAFQHALGNIDPVTLVKVDDWNPDVCKLSVNSIWNNKIHIIKTPVFTKSEQKDKKEKNIEQKVIQEQEENLGLKELLAIYTRPSSPNSKKRKREPLENAEYSKIEQKVINPFSKRNATEILNNEKQIENATSKINCILNEVSSKSTLEEIGEMQNTAVQKCSSPQKKNDLKVRSPVLKRVKHIRSSFLKQKKTSENISPKFSCFFKTDTMCPRSDQLEKDNILTDLIKVETNEHTKQKLTKVSVIYKNDISQANFIKTTEESTNIAETNSVKQVLVDISLSSDASVIRKEGIAKFHTEHNSVVKVQSCRRLGLSKIKLQTEKRQQTLLEKFGFVKKSMT